MTEKISYSVSVVERGLQTRLVSFGIGGFICELEDCDPYKKVIEREVTVVEKIDRFELVGDNNSVYLLKLWNDNRPIYGPEAILGIGYCHQVKKSGSIIVQDRILEFGKNKNGKTVPVKVEPLEIGSSLSMVVFRKVREPEEGKANEAFQRIGTVKINFKK